MSKTVTAKYFSKNLFICYWLTSIISKTSLVHFYLSNKVLSLYSPIIYRGTLPNGKKKKKQVNKKDDAHLFKGKRNDMVIFLGGHIAAFWCSLCHLTALGHHTSQISLPWFVYDIQITSPPFLFKEYLLRVYHGPGRVGLRAENQRELYTAFVGLLYSDGERYQANAKSV